MLQPKPNAIDLFDLYSVSELTKLLGNFIWLVLSPDLLLNIFHVICCNFPLLRCLLSPSPSSPPLSRSFLLQLQLQPSTSTSSFFLSLSLLQPQRRRLFPLPSQYTSSCPFIFLGDSSEYEEFPLLLIDTLFASLFSVVVGACLYPSRNRSLTTVCSFPRSFTVASSELQTAE